MSLPVPETVRHWGRRIGPPLAETARRIGPSARLLTTTEAHTYAYSVAANCLLASLPFLFLMLWVANHLLPSLGNQGAVIGQLVTAYLPTGQRALLADAQRLANRHTVQVFSLVMLAISSSGVFLPLEVALNHIWRLPANRGYLGNQLISLALVAACGAVAYSSVLLAGLGEAAVAAVTPARWTWLIAGLDWLLLHACAAPATIGVFFLIYWWLPNGPAPAAQVWPAAVYTGLLAEVFKSAFQWLLPVFDFRAVYGASLNLAVTLIVWGYGGALLLLFGASLSARDAVRLPEIRLRRLKNESGSKAAAHLG